jgi:hypothetical protein
MSERDKRKAAIAAYKERKRAVGVFALRCKATGETWVGRTPNLDTIQNRCWFTLRAGSHPIRSLQEAWTAHGEESFAFEILEQLEDEEQHTFLDDVLKERAASWRSKLNAASV